MGRCMTGPATNSRRPACLPFSWAVRADSAWSSMGLEAPPGNNRWSRGAISAAALLPRHRISSARPCSTAALAGYTTS